jgi:polyhydroxyalkanoate synthesis regulator phasin
MRWGIALALALGLVPALARAQADVGIDDVVKTQTSADEASRASQERINKLDDETNSMLSEYRRSVADAESFATYAAQLDLQVQSQNEEMASAERQLAEIETASREIGPLMDRMLATLDEFVGLDVPFLQGERRDRIKRLKEMMGRADVTISEKYRRIIEAYQVEMDYGRTVESYEAKLGDGDDARTVQFLRIGRVGLLYQTLDGKETGYWDAIAKGWVVDDSYAGSFKEGIAVAKKTRAPEMLIIPVPAPKGAS